MEFPNKKILYSIKGLAERYSLTVRTESGSGTSTGWKKIPVEFTEFRDPDICRKILGGKNPPQGMLGAVHDFPDLYP